MAMTRGRRGLRRFVSEELLNCIDTGSSFVQTPARHRVALWTLAYRLLRSLPIRPREKDRLP